MQMPARIGKYEIVELLALNLGVLYKARDSVAGRAVVLKVFAGPEARQRLLSEVEILDTLQHPNIVEAYESGELEGSPYIAYEYLEGEFLDSVTRTGSTLTLLQKLDIIVEVSEALQYVHTKGIIHHNVKPSNVMLLRDGKVKLVGFEAACPAGQAITGTAGGVTGTMPFTSPEILLGQGADQQADIFALGVTFFQLVEGNLPFEGANSPEIATKILHEPPSRSHQARDLHLPELQATFDKALAKQKDQRYRDCSDFREDLIRLRQRLELGGATGGRENSEG